MKMKLFNRQIITGVILLLFLPSYGQDIERFSKNLDEYNRLFTKEKLMVHTDKDVYTPGEDIWFKTYVFSNLESHLPVSNDLYVLITGINGDILVYERLPVNNNTTEGHIKLPPNTSNGLYSLFFFTGWMKNQGHKGIYHKKIVISKAGSKRLNAFCEFDKNYYKPGDPVEIHIQLPPFLSTTSVEYSLQDLNGAIEKQKILTDKNAGASIRFLMNEEYSSENLFLMLEVSKNKTLYTDAIKIPVIKGKADILFYPEGGNIIEGMDNRVYAKISDSKGFPVPVDGQVTDESGKALSNLFYLEDATGYFSVHPEKNKRYYLELATGEKEELPLVKSRGIGLMYRGFTNDNLNFIISPSVTGQDNLLSFILLKNNTIIYASRYKLNKSAFLKVPAKGIPAGIITALIIDDNNMLKASEQFYLPQTNTAETITTSKKKYPAFEKVTLTIHPDMQLEKNTSYSLSVSSLESQVNNFLFTQLFPDCCRDVYFHEGLNEHSDSINEFINLMLLTENNTLPYDRILQNIFYKPPEYVNYRGLSGKILDEKYASGAKIKAINPINLRTYNTVSDKDGYFNIEFGDDIVDLRFLTFSAVDKTGKKRLDYTVDDSFLHQLIDLGTVLKKDRKENRMNEILTVGNTGWINNVKYRKPKKVKPDNNPKLSNQLYYAQFIDMYSLVNAIKPFSLLNNKIIFNGMTQSISSVEGAHIVIDDQYYRDDASVLQTLNPSQVANIEIITDVASMQKYGSFITTAVIKIDTKKMEPGDLQNDQDNSLRTKEFRPILSLEDTLLSKNEETTLLWIPEIMPGKFPVTYTFYTSGVKGKYIARLVGTDEEGNMSVEECVFEVE